MRLFRRQPRMIREVQRVRVEPGDVLVFELPDANATKDQLERIRGAFDGLFPVNEVLCIAKGSRLSVYGKDGAFISHCEHDYIDIRNEVVTSGEMCQTCGALSPSVDR